MSKVYYNLYCNKSTSILINLPQNFRAKMLVCMCNWPQKLAGKSLQFGGYNSIKNQTLNKTQYNPMIPNLTCMTALYMMRAITCILYSNISAIKHKKNNDKFFISDNLSRFSSSVLVTNI